MKLALSWLLIAGLLLSACNSARPTTTATPVPTSTPLPEALNEPLPEYLQVLVPKPGAVLPWDLYSWGAHYLGMGQSVLHDADSSICAHINVAPLLDWGENWHELSPFRVTVDGKEVPSHPEVYNLLLEAVQFDDSGKVIGSKGMGPIIQCWKAELEPGVHVGIFQAQTTAGETLTYTWSFEIVE